MPEKLIIRFNVKQEKLLSFRNIMDDVKTQLAKIPGCNSVNIFNDTENIAEFVLIEDWDSKEEHAAHVQNLIASGQWQLIAEHLASDPTSSYYKEI